MVDMNISHKISRSLFLKQAYATSAALFFPGILPAFSQPKMVMRKIPSTGELIPAIGLGSWITFDVGDSESELQPMRNVLKTFADLGGTVIDSSPMYGRSEKVIGQLASELGITKKLWMATKVWTSGEDTGKSQIENSRTFLKKWPSLIQVHNLQALKTHLKTLRSLKEEGKLRYIGITHYLNSAHGELAELVKNEKLDFIQVNLSVRNTAAENYLIPLAADKGVGVIINRPFESGLLFDTVSATNIPSWASDWGISTWAAFFLKYLISNVNISCAIPATSQVNHLKENMAASLGPLPDGVTRKKMVEFYKNNAK